jgi:hypothetical protein
VCLNHLGIAHSESCFEIKPLEGRDSSRSGQIHWKSEDLQEGSCQPAHLDCTNSTPQTCQFNHAGRQKFPMSPFLLIFSVRRQPHCRIFLSSWMHASQKRHFSHKQHIVYGVNDSPLVFFVPDYNMATAFCYTVETAYTSRV